MIRRENYFALSLSIFFSLIPVFSHVLIFSSIEIDDYRSPMRVVEHSWKRRGGGSRGRNRREKRPFVGHGSCKKSAAYFAQVDGDLRKRPRARAREGDNISARVTRRDGRSDGRRDATRRTLPPTRVPASAAAFSICLSALSSVLPIAERQHDRRAPLFPCRRRRRICRFAAAARTVRNVTIIAHAVRPPLRSAPVPPTPPPFSSLLCRPLASDAR